MSLVPDYGGSSSEETTSSENSDSDNEEEITSKDASRNLLKPKLPTPNFGNSEDTIEECKTSVFKNPFIEAENAKAALLQKHVKMTDTKDNIKVINGKKICWNYRKGRCRFGHNCKYAHDSDIQKTPEQIEKEKNVAIQHSVVCQSGQTGQAQYILQTPEKELGSDDETTIKKKRKRPGLTQGLVPGKKVMKQYLKTQKT